MKSSFLLSLILGALVSTQVIGQTKTLTTTTPADTKTAEAQKSSFEKFYERLSISHFSILTTPTLGNWNSENAAISPEWSQDGAGGYSPCKKCDTYSMNLWNQINFGYNFGAKMKFNIIPRYTIFLDTANDQSPGERGTILLEDALVGFSGVIYSSTDKKLNLWARPGIRLPTSHFSRHYNQKDKDGVPGVGRLNYQLEVVASLTYDFNPKFQLGLSAADRYWIFEQRFNDTRRRIYVGPNFTYTVNDTTKVIGYYENIIENNKNHPDVNGREQNYKSYWRNAMIGVGKDITPKLNIYPYVSTFVNDVPYSAESVFLGAWITYVIK